MRSPVAAYRSAPERPPPAVHPAARARTAPTHDSLRLLLCIPYYPPVIGGAEIHVARLAAALARRGHRVHVLTTHAPPMPHRRRWHDPEGIAVTAVASALPRSLRPRAYVAEVALRLALARPRYDAVELFLPGLHVVAGLAAARWRGTASAVMFGSTLDVPLLSSLRLGRWQLAGIRRWADAVVVLNDEMRRDFMACGVDASRITWLPCSVDTRTFAPPTPHQRTAAREELQLSAADFVVAFVGRLVAAKNLPALLAGFGRFAQRAPQARLVIVGDGGEREALEQLAGTLAPAASVRFLGERVGDDVAQVLRAADVFAMVSRSEGIPCALIEAMAVGLPALVHDIPALGQLVTHDVHGVRVPVDDADGLEAALRRLAGDAALRQALGANARRVIEEEYSAELVAARHERLYRDAMARRQVP